MIGGVVGGVSTLVVLGVVVILLLKKRGILSTGKQEIHQHEIGRINEMSSFEGRLDNETSHTYEGLHHDGNPNEQEYSIVHDELAQASSNEDDTPSSNASYANILVVHK